MTRPGFQGSETTDAEVTVYRQTGDPVSRFFGLGDREVVTFGGRSNEDPDASLVRVTTSKGVGPSAGSWSVTLKPGTGDDLLRLLNDDDWVDISFSRHGRKWHVMRGLIDDIREVDGVGGSGATTRSLLISGRDFTKVLEETVLYQDIFAATEESVSGLFANRIFQTDLGVTGVADFIRNGVTGYLQAENDTEGRTAWFLPRRIPNAAASRAFAETLAFWTSQYNAEDWYPRVLLQHHWVSPQGKLWPWLTQRADPVFTEVFCDTLPKWVASRGNYAAEELADGLPVGETQMTVVVRDRPYPDLDTTLEGPWFRLPLHEVARQEVGDRDVGRTGHERFNAFFHQPASAAEQMKSTDPLLGLVPHWAPGDVDRHGMRRFDVQSIWIPDFSSGLDWATYLGRTRSRIRDWHMMDAYLLNGTLGLRVGRPEIRVGTRVRIPAPTPSGQETYYCENVDHAWRYGQGLSTSLGVTRGWRGTDRSLLDAMLVVADNFKVPSIGTYGG